MAAVRSASTRLLANRAFLTLCLAATSIAMLVLAILLLAIFVQGWSGLSWDFLTGLPSRKADKAGVFVALMGSLWVCAICGLLALPLGVATAVFLEEFAQKTRFTRIVQTNIMNLAGVPSIVYGILGLTAFARMFGAFGNLGRGQAGYPGQLLTEMGGKTLTVNHIAIQAVELGNANGGLKFR